jgi:4-hydroxy-tetrahydrodipicolinate synthase
VDEKALKRLVELQIQGGVDGLVPVGTTGESPTLSHEENIQVIELVIRFAKGRCKIIAGTGSNSTEEAVKMTRLAKRLGADATLQVVPYYNKPTQEGLYQHFRTIAEKGGLPVFIYDIPGRTGVSIRNETIIKLHKDLPAKIIGIKEASGSCDRITQLRTALGDDFSILCGDDSLTLPMMSVGADGVISVASNVFPAEVSAMVSSALGGDFVYARTLHAKLFQVFKDLFLETNPIPVKAALAMRKIVQEVYRLPLTPMRKDNRAQLQRTLQASRLI